MTNDSEHFESIAPGSVKVKVIHLNGGHAYLTPIDNIDYKTVNKTNTETFGREAIPQRSGGSIPFVALFEKN